MGVTSGFLCFWSLEFVMLFDISALHQLCMSVFVPMWHAYSSLHGVILGAGPSNPDGIQFNSGTTACSV